MKKIKEVSAEVEVSKMIDKVWRPAMITLILVGVGYGAYIGYTAYQVSTENKAQEKLFVIQKAVEDKTEELTKPDETQVVAADKNVAAADKKTDAKAAAKTEAIAPAPKPKEIEKSPESLVKNFEGQIKSYENFISEHQGHKAAYMAAMQLAGLSVVYKDLTRAERVLTEVISQAKNDLFSGLVLSQLGTVLMDQKKYPQAITHFTSLIDDKKQTYFHPQALLRLGACHLESGEFDKAEAMFKRLEADFPTTQAASEAKNLIKLLALKKAEKI